MLHRKYYDKIAKIIRDSKTKDDIVNGLIDFFLEDNPNFDPVRFRRAIEGEKNNKK